MTGFDGKQWGLTDIDLSPIGTDIEYNINMKMIEKIKGHLKEKIKKNIIRYGFQFGIFALCLEVFEHTILPALMIYIGRPELCWIGATPLDEFVIYPLAIRFIFKKGGSK